MHPDQVQSPQLFHFGVKAFISDERGRLLVVNEAETDQWEVPGGRLNVGEELTDLTTVLRREIEEELGPATSITIGQPFTAFVRQRTKTGQPGDFVALIGFRCQYHGGPITISHEHSEFRWVDRDAARNLNVLPAYRQPLENFFNT